MASNVTPAELDALLRGATPFALLDVREAGEYNSTHIPGSCWLPRRRLEYQLLDSVPYAAVPVVLCDDDGRRATLAARTVEEMGYADVRVLEGGINAWVNQGFSTEWGMNVPSKDFGERIEIQNHVANISADELHSRLADGRPTVILDSRTPEEYRRFAIPGGRSVPGGELALRITDIAQDLPDDAAVVVNCAGRTRSIIGARVLQRMGIPNVYALTNGTAGWTLAGYELERGADRVDLPQPSDEGVRAAEAYAARLAEEDGVRYLDIGGLQEQLAAQTSRTVYFIDVRTREEYLAGHIPGFRWVPGGQAVQRTDDVAVVKHAAVVFCCDGVSRATQTASWYRQMGIEDVFVVEGGVNAWTGAGNALEEGAPEPSPVGVEGARAAVPVVTAEGLAAMEDAIVLFVDTSQDFAAGHVPGARWIARGWLELRIGDHGIERDAPIVVTCVDGRASALAGVTLYGLGYTNVSFLEGGMASWRDAGLPVERGLTGVMAMPGDIPNDVVLAGPERSYADAVHYLRWEIALGDKYQE
ncbi:MAG: rhodanese-like domain-containing protein [Chloroflexota bacterium]|nr:rhodanese-like domain-containing protein [Chloroflexota bacterium]